MKIIEKAYAKINLTLNVVGKREDGYHNLKMIMFPISLYDEVTVEDNDVVKVQCNIEELSGKNNIVYRTIQLVKNKYNINKNVKVYINKKIPVGAGLGGGSADCAATLRALNKIWDLGLSLEELSKLGIQLGADVPFCIYNRQAIVSGIGEELNFIDCSEFYLVLVIPSFGVSTKEIFSNFNIMDSTVKDILPHLNYLKNDDISNLKKILFNDLEEVTIKVKPELGKIIKEVKDIDTDFLMTGSGSVLFSIYDNEKEAEATLQKLLTCKKNTLKASSVCNRFQNLI